MKPTYEELEAQVKQLTIDAGCYKRGMEASNKRLVQLAEQRDAVVAENVALKAFGDKLSDMRNDLNGEGTGIQGRAEVACQQIALEAAMEEFDTIKTPATDAILASLRAESRKQGAIFAANRMLAAWDAGFVDDTPENAADIARAILSVTEFMDDAPEGDFDRSFADEMLEAIAAQLRSQSEQMKGVQS